MLRAALHRDSPVSDKITGLLIPHPAGSLGTSREVECQTPSARRIPRPQPCSATLLGLFTLFFAEMWERFSYYGMRALLILYMIKGFLRYDDKDANAIYGAYCSLVYMTPFFGGMLADRLLGPRRAVIFGGLLMAAGHC